MSARTLDRIARGILGALLAGSLSAPAVTIPPDLEARASELRRQASPQLNAWVNEQGAALAKARGPVDSAAYGRTIHARFTRKASPTTRNSAAAPAMSWAVLGDLNGADIEAISFLVLMDAAKSAQEDLKSIMAHVKAINNAKAQQRSNMQGANRLAGPTASATPVPDRVTELVTAARSVQGKTAGANLTLVVAR